MKQRSFYMDDETYALIEAYAARLGTSNGTALRMLVRHELLDAPAEPVSQRWSAPETEAGVSHHGQQREREPTLQQLYAADGVPPAAAAAAAIVLPPDKQETFKVPDRFKEKGPRAPKAVHSDDDF